MTEQNNDRESPQNLYVSQSSAHARNIVLNTDRFHSIQSVRETPTFEGFWDEVFDDAEGQTWQVTRTNGYSCQRMGDERMTTLGVNACFAGILTFELNSEHFTVILHSNPFDQLPVTKGKLVSPFQIFNNQLPDTAVVEGLNIVHRPSVDRSSIQAAADYIVENHPTAEVKYSELPFDERFDLQIVNGETTAWKARKSEPVTAIQ